MKQNTIKNNIISCGVGLHSGKEVCLRLIPAPVDTGVVFRRIDLEDVIEIPAIVGNVSDTSMNTTISAHGYSVSTIEHLMAALSGMGVDNVYVELDAAEVPIMDGSSRCFVDLIKSVGILPQAKKRKYIKILSPIEVTLGDKVARLEPAKAGFSIKFAIDFDHPAFDKNCMNTVFYSTSHNFDVEISDARTFGFIKDIEKMNSLGLALGASLDNAIGLDESKILNDGGLRYKDEFVKHKVLDALGDVYLLGAPVIGSFYGYKSGHELNSLLTKALLSSPESWKYTTMDVVTKAKQHSVLELSPG